MSPLTTQRTLAPIVFLETASPHLFILADTHTHTKGVCIPILSVIVGPRFKEDWETKC